MVTVYCDINHRRIVSVPEGVTEETGEEHAPPVVYVRWKGWRSKYGWLCGACLQALVDQVASVWTVEQGVAKIQKCWPEWTGHEARS